MLDCRNNLTLDHKHFPLQTMNGLQLDEKTINDKDDLAEQTQR